MRNCTCIHGPSGSKTCNECVWKYNNSNSSYKNYYDSSKECKICGSKGHSWETCPKYINLYNETMRQFNKARVIFDESVLDTLYKRRQRNFSKKSRKSKNAKRKNTKRKKSKSKKY
jgi:NAD-dependent SIR2 family protein deacetylase